jgi:hypothetical protein
MQVVYDYCGSYHECLKIFHTFKLEYIIIRQMNGFIIVVVVIVINNLITTIITVFCLISRQMDTEETMNFKLMNTTRHIPT